MKWALMFSQIICVGLVVWGACGIFSIKNFSHNIPYKHEVGETVYLKPDSALAMIRSRSCDLNIMDTTLLEPEYEVMEIKSHVIIPQVSESLIYPTEKISFKQK